MHKTCYNCAYYHDCLSEKDSYYHIHDYCEKFNQVMTHNLESKVNSFLDDHWATLGKAISMNDGGVNDDFETGEAICWMFYPINNPEWSDEWYKENKAHNRSLAIRVLEYMFERDRVWDEYDTAT